LTVTPLAAYSGTRFDRDGKIEHARISHREQ
jgi:hypothetical protein